MLSTGRRSRTARNLAENQHCVVCAEQANEAVIVEGIAEEVADVALRRGFLKRYERKYAFVSAFEADILSLKEPIYAVRPAVALDSMRKNRSKQQRAGGLARLTARPIRSV